MVAEAFLLVFHALVGTTGQIASIEFILLQKEFGRMDEDSIHLSIYVGRHQNMIQTVPLTFITIGTLHAITALCLLGNVL